MKKKLTLWKLKRLEKKIEKVFDELGCDELLYIPRTGDLWRIHWTYMFADIDKINERKQERIDLIVEYMEVLERYNGI